MRTFLDNRIDYIDYAKAIGIFLVVLAHTQLRSEITDWIYVFHMPLFFFLSGFLFDYSRHPTFKGFVSRRFRQLIIPYVLINVITYLLWLFVFRHYGADSDMDIIWYKPLIAFLLGNGGDMVHNVPLWFLLCLFVVETVFYRLFREANTNMILLGMSLFAVVGYLNYIFNPILLPFSLGTAFVAIVFYGIGYLCAHHHIIYNNVLLWILSIIVTIVIVSYNGRIYMHVNYYSNYLLFLVGAVAGIYMMICLSKYLSKIGVFSFISFIGKHTLLICGFHLMTFTLIKGAMVYVLHLDPLLLNQAIAGNILFSIVSILLCCLLVLLYEKIKGAKGFTN